VSFVVTMLSDWHKNVVDGSYESSGSVETLSR
jgi:hypothetical protein